MERPGYHIIERSLQLIQVLRIVLKHFPQLLRRWRKGKVFMLNILGRMFY